MTKKSTLTKARYHVHKTRDWLEGQGFKVWPMEHSRTIFVPGRDGKPARTVFVKQDTRASDLLACDGECDIWIQVKANPGDVSKGIKDMLAETWPKEGVKRWVACWPPRRKMADGPEITEV